MRVPRRSWGVLLTVGLAIACLLGQVGVVSLAQAGGTLAGPLSPRSEHLALLMSEDFEGAWPTAGWNVFDGNGAANGEQFWDEDDFKPHGGSQSAWAANGGADGLDPAVSPVYWRLMDSWMVYGPFDLSPYNAGNLHFYWWNVSEGDYDFFSWGASHDGVSFDWTWVSGNSPNWSYQDVDLSSYAGDASVWIAFRFRSDGSFEYEGPFVDDIEVWGKVLPADFGKMSPADDAASQPIGLMLTWEAAADAASYEYCLDTSDDDACDYTWVPAGGATSVGVGPLASDTTYHWQVRAINEAGTIQADSGAWWDFTTGVPPDAFGKVAPADGANGQPLNPALSWEAAAGATSYEYCFDPSDNDTCSSGWESTGTATSVALAGLETNTYYWQVRAVNDFGTTYADGAEWWGFTTVATAVFRSMGDYDGWVLERDEESGKGGDTLDAAGTTARLGDDGSDRQYRSILHFDTATLPDTAVIVGVTLRIKRESFTGVNPFTTHGLLKVDIQAGAYHDLPALEKLDFHAVGSRGNVGRFVKTPTLGWYRAPLRASSYALVNLTGTTQFRLRFDLDDNDDLGADYLSFYTGNTPTDTDRPELTVTYYVP